MDYQFENLGPERFQEFCQALLVKHFPKLQCFPIAQPDGGRDAISFFQQNASEKFLVFQVKYVRRPLEVEDPHKLLFDFVEGEASKVAKLIPKGAVEYYLLTNVPGTAHLDVGAIDKVQKIFNEHLKIPAQCWWRADLSRRLDDAWNLKWAYPELLSGTDFLRLMVEVGSDAQVERRTRVIKAFLRDQYDRETEVKFKQVELQNQLLDLFIDVPVDFEQILRRRRRAMTGRMVNTIGYIVGTVSNHMHETAHIGTARLLLHPVAQEILTRVVLEGAPGQGKSTITQYLCQIYRQRILEIPVDDSRIPEAHLLTGKRLPFRVDCRDLAAWINNKNPFSSDESVKVPSTVQRSVEGFIAAQIEHFSGGAEFSISDLQAIVSRSAVFLVFDGLDEVADLKLRQGVVNQILIGTNRLDEVCQSLQVIVTSRPAAFANSPGMPDDKFVYLELASLTRPLIEEYASKWAKARHMSEREAIEVQKVLASKLDQPHLRELARNPMQLAILLSLIHTRGVSLPDKRTSLYDNYVELFFNREAEKSEIVRDRRDLLIDLHRYLAWILHSEAETKKNRGSLSEERLRNLVDGYLKEEGHNPNLTSQLFTGMVERVVALVSRVEGTFEFEVQPLREYFAARFLYSTTPYSPVGRERRGALPDRFDAIAKNFFWMNVTRFFAGCYDKGQLPSLVERLEELSRSETLRDTSYAQELAAILLGDWVFAQHPKSMRQVVALLVSQLALRKLVAGRTSRGRNVSLALPSGSGREELLGNCFTFLESSQSIDYRREVAEVIREHAPTEEVKSTWLTIFEKLSPSSQQSRNNWITNGLYLGILPSFSDAEIDTIGDKQQWNSNLVQNFLRGTREDVLLRNESRANSAVALILDGAVGTVAYRRKQSVLGSLADAVNVFRYTVTFEAPQPVSLNQLLRHRYAGAHWNEEMQQQTAKSTSETLSKVTEFVSLVNKERETLATDWSTQLSPWNNLVEGGRRLFGEQWTFVILATAAAAIKNRTEKYANATNLYDKATPLCERMRYARLRAGTPSWWQLQFETANDKFDRITALLAFTRWAGTSSYQTLWGQLERLLEKLDNTDWSKLGNALRNLNIDNTNSSGQSITFDKLPKGMSERAAVCVYWRSNQDLRTRIFETVFRKYEGDDLLVLEHCQQEAINCANRNPNNWMELLPLIRNCYAGGAIVDRYWGRTIRQHSNENSISTDAARTIVTSPDQYPSSIVAFAESHMREIAGSSAVAVGNVALIDKWFI